MYGLHTYMCLPYRRKNIHISWGQNLWSALSGPNTPWELDPSSPPGAEGLVMMNAVYDNVKTPRTWPFHLKEACKPVWRLPSVFPAALHHASATSHRRWSFPRALVQGRWNVLNMVASALCVNSILLSISWFKKLWGCLGRWLSQ